MGVPDFDTALEEISAGPAPTDFADLALRHAARHVRRTRMLAAAGATALITVLALVPVALRMPLRHAAPVGEPQGGGRMAVLSYAMFTGPGSSPGRVTPYYAWDPTSHSYIRTASVVRPSPDGRWGMVIGPLGVGIAPWADAIRQRNLHWRKVTGAAKWSPTGSVIVADTVHKTTSWINPRSMDIVTVDWPSALLSPQKVVYGFGGVATVPADNTVVYWTYDKDARQYTTMVWTDIGGHVSQIKHAWTIRVSTLPPSLGTNQEANPSPDGSYINLQLGVVVDTRREQLLYKVPEAVPVGWYSANTVAFCIASLSAHTNVAITPYLVSGPRLTSTPMDRLPGFLPGAGFASVFAAAVGPDTDGALTF